MEPHLLGGEDQTETGVTVSEMAKLIPLVGGPRDGQLVEDFGPEFREPVPALPVVRLYDPGEPIALSDPIRLRRYKKERWSGDMAERYVLVTADLGQSSFDPVDPEHWRG